MLGLHFQTDGHAGMPCSLLGGGDTCGDTGGGDGGGDGNGGDVGRGVVRVEVW